MIAAAGPSPLWYLARGAGAVTLVLLSATVVLGITGRVGLRLGPRTPRFIVDGLHRNLSLLVLLILALHIASSLLDPFAHLHVLDAVVPLASAYRPVWLGMGALAFDILLALVVTSLLRRRLGLRTWRAVHWAAYACWPIAVVHGLGTGTDARAAWMQILTVACVAAVAGALLLRAARTGPVLAGQRIATLAAGAAVLGGIAIFAVVGPLRPGWAGRAGTPAKLLASVRPVAAPVAANGAPRASATLAVPFTASLQGDLRRSQLANGDARTDIAAALGGARTIGRLAVTIVGQPLPSGGVQMSSSRVSVSPVGGRQRYSGQIIALQGDRLLARLVAPGSRAIDLLVALHIGPDGTTVSGTATGREVTGA